ncbi:MAG: hypothetical protein EP330_20105 [Deltaproteobacteria bacterium]|nr:MAG: hypothetical protein EP330_20105 [Deltaproteobacteria bacterium]
MLTLALALALAAHAGGWTDHNDHDPGVALLEVLTLTYGDHPRLAPLAATAAAHDPEWTHPTVGDPGRAWVVEVITRYLAGESTPREALSLLEPSDLTWGELAPELARRIPEHAPEWTNPSQGDPGRTLVHCEEGASFVACDVVLEQIERREELLLGLVNEGGVWRETYREIVVLD